MGLSRIVIGIFLVFAGAPLGCEQPVSSFEIAPKEVEIFNREDTSALTIDAFDKDGMEIDVPHVIWRSSDPDVVEVDDSGTLSVKKSGTATITAMIDNLKRERRVKVDLCAKLTIESPEVSLQPGAAMRPVVHAFNDKGQPSASPIEWSVADNAIAAVDETGRITGVAVGQTTAKVVCGEKSAAFRINVAYPQAAPVEVVPESPPDRRSDVAAPGTPENENENEDEAAADKVEGDEALEDVN